MLNSYRVVLKLPSMLRYMIGLVFTKLGGWMWSTGLVLFVLYKYDSTELSGISVLFSVIPGVIISPVAGAMVDKYDPRKIITIGQTTTGLLCALIPVLSLLGALRFWILLVIVIFLSLFRPLVTTAYRALLPALVPANHWDQANALDGIIQETAVIMGPAIVGLLTGFLSADDALFGISLFWILGAVGGTGIKTVPQNPSNVQTKVLQSAWSGLRFLLNNPSLRGLSFAMPFYVMTFGVFYVGLPILVEERLHWEAAAVGGLWTILGFASLTSNLVFGRYNSQGRERNNLALGMFISLGGFALVAVSTNLVMIICGLLIIGSQQGLVDINLHSLRQRRADPQMYGRVVSLGGMLMSLGSPIGSSIAGVTLTKSLTLTLFLPVISGALAVLMVMLLIPRKETNAQSNLTSSS
jgi:MFS family permease